MTQRTPPNTTRHRRCVVLRGREDETRDAALPYLANLSNDDVLWISDADSGGRFTATTPNRVKKHLGQSFYAVVLNLHHKLIPDVVGQAHGLIWGGGGLILRMPPLGTLPTAYTNALGNAHDFGRRFFVHFERALAAAALSQDASPFSPPSKHTVHGTSDQAAVVEQLERLFASPTPNVAVLFSDRGRGKSSALGLALQRCLINNPSLRIAITAGNPGAAEAIFQFSAASRAHFVPPQTLLHDLPKNALDVMILDEAAQIPVPLLKQLVTHHTETHIAFATTTRGYEGTGRGFILRFLTWLRLQERPVHQLSMRQPIRWSEGDPLERFIFDTLFLDARPDAFQETMSISEVAHLQILDRDELLHNTALLRGIFGLLIHAHYRTTPGDLQRLLDAPNLRVHALQHHGKVIAATLVALESRLPDALREGLFWGTSSVRGRALQDSLIGHLGYREAASMSMVRSMRIAVHPKLRRRGLGTRLVEHVHQTYSPDLFGTLFGATPELLTFRRAVGYDPVRVSASRGSRTGEPSVMMVRPITGRAQDLFQQLRTDLARDLPQQLRLFRADRTLLLDPVLVKQLRADLDPHPKPLSDTQMHERVCAFAFGPRTFESSVVAVGQFVEAHCAQLNTLKASEQALIRGRVLQHHSWARVSQDTKQPSLPATMRALRRAVRSLIRSASPETEVLFARTPPGVTR